MAKDKNYGSNFQFKGQVKIEDVSKQLDLLVGGINDMIDTYNDAGYVTDIDLNDVSSELSPMDYTLSVGGLKKVLDAYEDTVLGCNVFTDSKRENLYISSGLLLTRNGGYGLPSAIIKNEGQTEIWYSPSKKQYVGDSASIVTETSFTMPNMTSNETWGKVSVNDWVDLGKGRRRTFNWNPNSHTYCFNATKGLEVQKEYRMWWVGALNWNSYSRVDWMWSNFPKPIKASKLKFNLGPYVESNPIMNVQKCKVEVQVGSNWITLWDWKDIDGPKQYVVDLGGKEITGVLIAPWYYGPTPAGCLYNVSIEGLIKDSIPATGSITGADDLVKVAVLNPNAQGIMNVHKFKTTMSNTSIAAGGNIRAKYGVQEAPSDKVKDYYFANPNEDVANNLSIQSKIYYPNREGIPSFTGTRHLSPIRIRKIN